MMEHFVFSAFADEYAVDFPRQLDALNSFGIDYLEIRHVAGKNISTLGKNEIHEVKKALDCHGIKVNSIGSPLGKIPLDDDMDAHMETAKNVFETANILDAKCVRMFSFYPPEGKAIENCRDEVIAALEKMVALAEPYGILLCHENEANLYGETPERCLDILKYFGGRIKAVFDMGNFVLGGYDPLPAYGMLKEYIEYFHIKDALFAGAIVPAGKGEARIGEILSDHATTVKKETFVTLEPHLQVFPGLRSLTGIPFDQPYQYDSQEAAFTDAVIHLKEILKCL